MGLGAGLGRRLRQRRKQQRVNEIDAIMKEHDLSEDMMDAISGKLEYIIDHADGTLEYVLQGFLIVLGIAVTYLGSKLGVMAASGSQNAAYLMYGIGLVLMGLAANTIRRGMQAGWKMELLGKEPMRLIDD